ncbi:PQQ-dependent sugar dehydrogenase [Roseicyclus sp. F158]|uniref:PQQ-dependent sugar dehydrogenase n=1 Tax=Tropicimonas omnivorans TaxID=3075590 RepID=A0ABU3DII7_9RHOB|nr:PQQ-dependent sugar dehydrogenase [Roseicyclus sp. F158]MDT0683524.1 PQQ-dependent sugar dehydrogenase [Roseicyclus sp. F158]
MTSSRRPDALLATAASALALTLALPATAQTADPVDVGPKNAPDQEPAFAEQTRAPQADSGVALTQDIIAEGLTHPWGIAVLPGGDGYLVTERSGDLRHITPDGTISDPIAGIPEVLSIEQAGLLDVAIGPDFGSDRMIYWTYSKPQGEGMSATAAARGVLSEDLTEVTDVEDIFVQEPASPSPMHYGSRILFDGEGHALITTGEHFTEEERVYAQDLDKTYGKTVRVNLDGSVPDDNPFADQSDALPEIWSYGHRNIQGAAIRDNGEFWTIEHGPKGGDELNHIEAGTNYGWPVISYGINYDGSEVSGGDTAQDGMEQPRYYWDPVIAPGGMTFYDGEMFGDWQGDLFIGALVSDGIVRLELDGDTVTGEERLATDLGRVRDVVVDEDGSFLLITDYDDGALLRLSAE